MKIKHTITFGLSFLLLTALLLIPQAARAQTGNESWIAEFYNNQNLSGSAALVRLEPTPSDNWGTGSPAPTIQNDQWSARWTRTLQLDGGEYQVQIQADDGVRVFIDNRLIIDEWHGHLPEQYRANFEVATGQHTLRVEFYDFVGPAFLNYGLTRVDNQLPIFPNETLAIVNVPVLNVRNQPNNLSPVIATLQMGEVLPVLDRNLDNAWVKLNLGVFNGWVDNQFVQLTNESVVTKVDTRPTATVIANLLNVRNIPDPIEGEVLTQIRGGETYPALRRNISNGWIQLDVEGTLGWVNENFIRLTNADGIPNVVSDVEATVNTGRLNVRARPTINSESLVKINFLETYPVLGRNASNTWIQLDVNGVVGWVNADFVDLNRDTELPILSSTVPNVAPAPLMPGRIEVTATPFTVNIRSGPGTQFDDLANLPRGRTAEVIGRNANNTWWQINYRDIVGWVSAEFARIEPNVNPNRIPVVR